MPWNRNDPDTQLTDSSPTWTTVLLFSAFSAVTSVLLTISIQTVSRIAITHDHMPPQNMSELFRREEVRLNTIDRDNRAAKEALQEIRAELRRLRAEPH